MKRILLFTLAFVLLLGCAPDPVAEVIAPAETPEPEPTPEPTPEPVENLVPALSDSIQGQRYKSRVGEMNIRSTPDTHADTNIVGTLGYEENVIVIGESGDFYEIAMEGGTTAFCFKSYMVKADKTLYANLNKKTQQAVDASGNLLFEKDGVTPVMLVSDLVDIRLFVPSAEINLVFATEENFFKEKFYKRSVPLLQSSTAGKLAKAADEFYKKGYTIKILDAYRPSSVEQKIYTFVNDAKVVPNPAGTPSVHSMGGAVDIVVLGEGMDLPEPMAFDATARRDNPAFTPEQKKNIDYITEVMEKAGFKGVEQEWWHFEDTASSKFLVTDLDLNKINMAAQ